MGFFQPPTYTQISFSVPSFEKPQNLTIYFTFNMTEEGHTHKQ